MRGIQIISLSTTFHFPRHTPRFNPKIQLRFCSHCSTITMNSGGHSNKPDDNSHIAGTWFSVPELRLRDHRFTVPLDYSVNHQHQKSSPVISVFAREVVLAGKEEQQLPYLLYLQGGPGFESPRPNEASGWIKKACEEYRVILLDQ
ncbi:hypothetical protein MKW94_021578, partial [Papaver nudicaule]|nr:hypothetical protein [Papaver nudicaule]